MFLRNIGKCLPNYTFSYSRKWYSSTSKIGLFNVSWSWT